VTDDFSLSADGTRLVCTRFEIYSNLWLAELAGSAKDRQLQTKPLTKGTAYFSTPSISPDGQWIAVASANGVFTNEGKIYKIPIAGDTPIQLTFSDGDHWSPVWSPDGKRIAFTSADADSTKVWIVDADGVQPRQMVRTQCLGRRV
jgi:Tol biopolymer transport system component